MSILSFFWHRSADNPGIYQIRNRKTGTIYIGSSVHIVHRWMQHRKDLCNGVHRNTALQQDWNRFGEGAFKFSVVEVVGDENMLINREQYWIDRVRKSSPCYNIKDAGGSNRRDRLRSMRKYGVYVPVDCDITNPYMTLAEETRFLALTRLVTGEWASTAGEIARFLRGQELSEDAILSLIRHYREG